jgi:hypothetical protein
VKGYYIREMAQRGWTLDFVANIMAGSSLDIVELRFSNEDKLISVSIMPQSEKLMYMILTWHY